MKWDCEEKPVGCEPPSPRPQEDCAPNPPAHDNPQEESDTMTNKCNDDCPATDDHGSETVPQTEGVLSPDVNVGDITLIGGDANVLPGTIAPEVVAPVDADVLGDPVSVGGTAGTADVGNLPMLANVSDVLDAGDLATLPHVSGNTIGQDVLDAGVGDQLVKVLADGDSAGLISGSHDSALPGGDVGSGIASLSAFDLSDLGVSAFDGDLSNVGAIDTFDVSSLVHGAVDALVTEADLFNVDIPTGDFGHHC